MAVELKVRWDGEAPGLAEHRFSVLALGKALNELHRALRTAATRLETGKDPNLAPPGRGKYTNRARALDVQIKSVEDGCVLLGMDVVMGDDRQLQVVDDDLAERAVVEVLEAVKSHKALAVGYLRALGSGVTEHSYHATRADGTPLVSEFSLGLVDMDETTVTPALIELSCTVEGVTFSAGKEAVILRDAEYGRVKAAAKAAQVERAIALHKAEAPVEARVFQLADGYRLLSLRDASTPRKERSPRNGPTTS